MAYNKYSLSDLQTKLQIDVSLKSWLLESYPDFGIDSFLLQILDEARLEPLNSEKARSELITSPVLKALRRRNPNKFSFFSGYQFNVEKKLDLTGFCDFIFSLVPNKLTIQNPVFFVVEAKKDDVEEGLGQCGAEMYAAQLFNERAENSNKVIYGCVTTAFSWAFLKLEGKNLYIDPNYVPLTFTEPHRVLAVLQWILDESLAN